MHMDTPKNADVPIVNKGRIAWCVLFPTLHDIERNIDPGTMSQLRKVIVDRVVASEENLECSWVGDALSVLPKTRINDWAAAHQVTSRLLERFRFLFEANSEQNHLTYLEQDIFLTPAIGLAEIEGGDQKVAFDRARIAATSIAGDNGRHVTFYQDPASEVPAWYSEFSIRQAFIRALREKEFQLAYQPKVELETGLLFGLEALIRAPINKASPLHGARPEALVNLAIQTDTLTEFTVFVAESALWQLSQWRHILPSIPFTMSINVLPRTILEGWDALLAAIPANGTQGLVIELTESFDDVSSNMEALRQRLKVLQDRGVEISIDDFGKGMSNIDRLTAIPCDEIKLDRLLISEATRNEANGNLVKSMINLANHYGIRVIAEGIESNDQWHFLSQTTCKAGQGFYISRPLSAEQTYLMLKRLADDSLSSTF